MYCEKLDILLNYRKSSIKPPKGLFLLIRFYEGFNREGGGGANLICGETGTTLLSKQRDSGQRK